MTVVARFEVRFTRYLDAQGRAERVLPLSLSFDHRAATGGEAGRFLNAVIADLSRAG